MGIEILPPDINEGDAVFTVSGNNIRYGLSAIKGLGRPVIEALVKERSENGEYKSLSDFATRLSGKEVNKRTVESFIKSGAFDSIPGTRKQLMQVYVSVLDSVNQEKKKAMTGQMTLFDFAPEDEQINYEYQMPDVGEFSKDELLAFEKEVLGIYVSGHPLEAFEGLLKKNTTATTLDFAIDEETNEVKVTDGEYEVVGGMVVSKTLKTTKTNNVMAFITIEDLFGTLEIIIFPRDYEKYKYRIDVDEKVLIKGKVAMEEDKPAKLICTEVIPFSEIPKEVWIRFSDKNNFMESEQSLYEILGDYDGIDSVVVYCENEKAIKRLPKSKNIKVNSEVLSRLSEKFSKESIRVVEKSIEKRK